MSDRCGMLAGGCSLVCPTNDTVAVESWLTGRERQWTMYFFANEMWALGVRVGVLVCVCVRLCACVYG